MGAGVVGACVVGGGADVVVGFVVVVVDGAVVVDFVVGFVDVGFGLDEVVFGFVVVRGTRVVVVRGARVVVVRGARVVGAAVRVGAVVGATVVASAVGRLDEVVDVLEEDDELELDEPDDEFDGVADVLDATEAGSSESLLLP